MEDNNNIISNKNIQKLVQKLRSTVSKSKREMLDNAADTIEKLQALAQNGQSAIDTNKRLVEKIKEYQEEIEEYQILEEMRRNREYSSKWIEYWRKKNNQSELAYPDWDEIFKDWENVHKENERLKKLLKEK